MSDVLYKIFVYHDAKLVKPCVMVRRGLVLVRACEHPDGTRTTIFTATKTSYTYLATEDANTSDGVSETKHKSDMARISTLQ